MRAPLTFLICSLLSGCSCGQWGPTDDLDLTPVAHPCDEYDATINPELADGTPGAAEVCNGRDDDCDGLVDVDDPDLVPGTQYWLDADGDGFGDFESPIAACEPADNLATQPGDCDDAQAATHPGSEETWYDGLDSDCDGLEDPDPCVTSPTQAPPVVDATCEVPATYALTLESAGIDLDGRGSSLSTPVVGQLTDDNGDGVITSEDIPDIVVVSADGGGNAIRITPGDGSAPPTQIFVVVTTAGDAVPTAMGQLALGDVDADGDPDIVGVLDIGGTCHPVAFTPDGLALWVQTAVELGCTHDAPALADLDGDGAVEVIVGGAILRGVDGSVRGSSTVGRGVSPDYVNAGVHAIAAELDGAPPMEVIVGNAVLDPEGGTLCTTGDPDGYPAVADLDGDGDGEIVVTGTGDVRIYDHQCAPVGSWALPDGGPGGPAALADLDGDGLVELAVSSNSFVYAYESSGALMWQGTVQDFSSGSAALAAFDFDGDGAAEIVSADELQLSIFGGHGGALLFRDEVRVSGTRNEFAIVADVDGDGAAEIVAPSEGPAAFYVFGESHGWWPGALDRWTQDAFVPAHSAPDLSLPASPGPPWPAENGFRWTPALPGGGAPDLVPAADLEVLATGFCDVFGGALRYWVQVRNRGSASADVDLAVALDGITSEGNREPISQLLFPGPLAPGASTSVTQTALIPFQTKGYVAIAFRALESTFGEPQLSECRVDNNETILSLP